MGHLSRPVTELAARMVYHTTDGQTPARILQGMKWYPYPQQRTEGQADFPYCQIASVTGGESYRVGARPGLVQPRLVIALEVANRRTEGEDALLQWIEKVIDAIETDTTGIVKPSLGGTRRPFDVQITQNYALDASLTSVLTVTIEPLIVERGDRRT